ncbi:MAG: hypothetical protein QOD06_2172, partial [Candidatus Binatota bacterium]|nr:hypothetical protein [Candidatus Binatota bacterium]
MLTRDRYTRPPGSTEWKVKGSFESTFRWEYQDGREKL